MSKVTAPASPALTAAPGPRGTPARPRHRPAAARPRHVARLLRARPGAGRGSRLAGRKMAAGIREKQTGERLPAAPGLGAGLPGTGRGAGAASRSSWGSSGGVFLSLAGPRGGMEASRFRRPGFPVGLLPSSSPGGAGGRAPGRRQRQAGGECGALGRGRSRKCRCRVVVPGGARWARGELWPGAGLCHPCGGCPSGETDIHGKRRLKPQK